MQPRSQNLAVILLSTLLTLANLAIAQDENLRIVSPISAVPSNEIHNGKLVWVDLLTTDVRKAETFYTSVFGWQSNIASDETYVELSHDGRVISSIVQYEGDDARDGDARWLVSISVPDVDAVVAKVAANGGEVLEAATDLPERGRYSVISDSQGAVLMLLRATGGDPDDSSPIIDEWAFAELWTDDVDAAVAFYQALVGYRVLRLPGDAGQQLSVLGSGGKARATVVRLPWDDVEPNWLPYIMVASVSGTEKRIMEAGGTVLVRSDESDRVGTAAIAMDPTGGVFAIQQWEVDQ
jgi:predicted enzyme related to lactoylglutathione lyase